ncbi:MAG TPA: DUF1987 domain-containing protein [Tenuifilaceae bacterium]|jgi:hypothetical protein|nr:DUF1987 domain-containing protein [Bacteroidales bacterium]HNT42321.1 DUF1987 domain-containing protein [Tenuifilaceae bacterium]MBP8642877.1 DUF1987 domain-containing protein [Bacteroidales bacterium]NLI88441.1 DUF1987 domain-containing protein [Bacteroidales bacterium]HNY09663.1 DUF1987 domain-containing protein [Tenuifilaceae bacterium]
MLKLELKETATTPYINFDPTSGVIRMEGRSIPENVIDFYQPILGWVEEYGKNIQPETTVHLKFEYFNTSSSKRIFDLMKKFEKIGIETGTKVTINWYYEEDDEDIFFAGNDYKALINKVEFNLIEIKPS